MGTTADILLVDDNQDTLSVLEQILQSEGLTVACAASAEDALSQLEGRQFRLLLTDLDMPGMDGIALARAVSLRAMPVCLMTGSIALDISHRADVAGIRTVLYKPFNPNELLRVIHEYLPEHGISWQQV